MDRIIDIIDCSMIKCQWS